MLLCTLTWYVRAASGSLPADDYWRVAIRSLQTEHTSAFMLMLHVLQGKLVTASMLVWSAALAWRRRWHSLLLFAAVVPVGMLVNAGLKLWVERPRPTLPPEVGSHGFAYPSGHVAAITLCCGYIVLETVRRTTKTSWRLASCVAAAAIVMPVMLSRVYLGVHHPSDVIAALLLGIVWLGLCAFGAEVLRASRRRGAPVVAPVSDGAIALRPPSPP